MSDSDLEDYEYGGFDIDLYEAPPLGDNNSYRLQNAPGENQRRHIIQEGKRDLTFHGDLFAVVHGTLTPDGDDATLIVMQFTFSGSEAYKRRFRKVDIMLKFGNGLGEEKVGGRDDPEVRAIAPEGEFELAHESTEEVSTMLTAGVSAPVAQGILELSAGIERGKTTVRTTRAKIFGGKRIEDRRFGKQNAALWKLQEDKIGQTGVPSTLRTAVLVVPQTEDGFRVFVEVDLTADTFFATEVKTRRMLGRSKVDPVYFSYERENFGPELPGVDPDNLSKCKLSDLGFVKTSTII